MLKHDTKYLIRHALRKGPLRAICIANDIHRSVATTRKHLNEMIRTGEVVRSAQWSSNFSYHFAYRLKRTDHQP